MLEERLDLRGSVLKLRRQGAHSTFQHVISHTIRKLLSHLAQIYHGQGGMPTNDRLKNTNPPEVHVVIPELVPHLHVVRSEERRVGKERVVQVNFRWSQFQ